MSVLAVLLTEVARRVTPPALRGLQATLILVLTDPQLRARGEGLVHRLTRRATGYARLDDLDDDLDALERVALALESDSECGQRAPGAQWHGRVTRLQQDLDLAVRLPRDLRGPQCDAIDTARLELLTEMLSVQVPRPAAADPVPSHPG